jgi:hypothetical protein
MNRIQKIAVATATAALAAFSAPSQALTITDSTEQNFSWSFATPTNPSRNLTGTGTVTVSGFNSNSLTLVFTLSNTAPTLGQGGDRLTAFGFGIDPNATGIAFDDDVDGGIVGAELGGPGNQTSQNIGNGIFVEVCGYSGPNCNGGSNDGIFAGDSDTFSIILTGTWLTSVNIDPLAFKYQTGTGSYEFVSSSGISSTSSNGNQVPEPGTLTLLGLGLLGLGYGRRLAKAK